MLYFSRGPYMFKLRFKVSNYFQSHIGIKGKVRDQYGSLIPNAVIEVVNKTAGADKSINHDITTGTDFDFVSYNVLDPPAMIRVERKVP